MTTSPRTPTRARTRGPLIGVTVAAMAVTGCGFLTGEESSDGDGEAASCTEQTLRLATIRAENDPTTLGAQLLAETLAEETDDQVTVEIYPNSQLGDANDIYASLADGQEVDAFYNGISLYPTLDGAEAFNVLSVPFLWDSYDQMRAVLATDRFQELMEDAAAATGVRVVATAGDAEPRALSANRPVETAADMEGLDLRIADAAMPQEFARALGARPQVVAFSDLYLSLNQGVVDAQENGAITMVNQSLMEVQSHYMPIDYIRDIQALQFSESSWQGLCAEQQDAVLAAAEPAGELVTESVATQMEEAIATLDAELEIVDVDVESFRTALDGAFEQFDGELWDEGLLEEVQALAEEHRE